MLRHRPGSFTDAAVDRSDVELRIVPRMNVPVQSEFVRGGDMTSVMNAIVGNRYIQVNAGVGAGKSTKLPLLIAEKTATLVVHTIPFHLAAYMCAKYVSKGRDDVHYIDDINADFPDTGVVLTTNHYMITRYFTDRFGKMPKIVLYMDENHESDCWTAVLRKMALSWSCVDKLILATATANPDSNLGVRMPGQRVDKKFSFVQPDNWRIMEAGKPWSAASIRGNVCLCVDRDSARTKLSADFREMGFRVFMLSKSTTVVEAEEALSALAQRSSDSIAVFVDYAWRSSFTIPNISTAIDAGEVKVVNVDASGKPIVSYRRAYMGEQHQFVNRFGRLGSDSVYTWSPEDPLLRICDVEAIEADAAALLYRMLGFRPPIEFAKSVLFDGSVPINLVAALQGDTPVACFRNELVEPWVKTDAKLVDVELPSAYEFEVGEAKYPKPARCQTMVEKRVHGRALSNASSVLELEQDAYSSIVDALASRPPSRDSVRTIESGELNNATVFQDPTRPVFVKPKRVAKRVQERRSMEALQMEQQAQVLEESHDHQHVERDVSMDSPGVAQVAGAVSKRSGVVGSKYAATDLSLGKYYYYEGIVDAPSSSLNFPRGYNSIVGFCESQLATARAGVLPERDKQYVMRTLLDKFNDATAKIMGMQRVIAALSMRMDEVEKFVDRDKFYLLMERIITEKRDATLDLEHCRTMMPGFMVRPLQPCEPLLTLEQEYMTHYMQCVEQVAVKRDPDKIAAYVRHMDATKPQLIQSMGKMRLLD